MSMFPEGGKERQGERECDYFPPPSLVDLQFLPLFFTLHLLTVILIVY